MSQNISTNEDYIYSPHDNEKDWRIDYAYFEIKEVINPHTVQSTNVDGDDMYLDSHGINTKREFRGSINIREVNSNLLADRYTVVENVRLQMSLKGLNFRAGSIANIIVPIKGLEGRSIRHIFDSKFDGLKFAIQIGFLINFAPNYSYMKNDNGIRITDMEQIISFGLGIGIDLAKISAQFFFRENLTGTRKIIFNNEQQIDQTTTTVLTNHSEILKVSFSEK